ncbi:glycosyltransferase family 4 protein [Akkermansiaceae bacterium]|nr:glycosyltransferase family 4 protein [Akkermansiaceae bacterium]
MKSLHILYFHQYFTIPSGSGGIRSYEMAQIAISRGHKVTIVCGGDVRSGLDLPEIKPGLRRGEVDGINIYQFTLPYSNQLNLFQRALVFLKYAARSSWLALRLDYDLLFATSTPLTAGIPGIAMKLTGKKKKFVFEVRDLWPELPRAMRVVKNPLLLWGMSILEWASYRAADGCIGLAPGIVAGIQKRCRKSLPVIIVPNGCDLEIFKPRNREPLDLPGIGSKDFVAVFTGAHGVANGLDAVLDAAKILQQREANHIKIVLIGDGTQKERLQLRANREGLGNVAFHSLLPKKDLTKVIREADCGLQILANIPAFYYGTSPNKFFDYISSGCPVLINYPGWIADLVTENQCGIAVPPDDPKFFADALIRMAESPNDCLKMGKRGRELAEGKFARHRLGGEWVSFLESVAKNSS